MKDYSKSKIVADVLESYDEEKFLRELESESFDAELAQIERKGIDLDKMIYERLGISPEPVLPGIRLTQLAHDSINQAINAIVYPFQIMQTLARGFGCVSATYTANSAQAAANGKDDLIAAIKTAGGGTVYPVRIIRDDDDVIIWLYWESGVPKELPEVCLLVSGKSIAIQANTEKSSDNQITVIIPNLFPQLGMQRIDEAEVAIGWDSERNEMVVNIAKAIPRKKFLFLSQFGYAGSKQLAAREMFIHWFNEIKDATCDLFALPLLGAATRTDRNMDALPIEVNSHIWVCSQPPAVGGGGEFLRCPLSLLDAQRNVVDCSDDAMPEIHAFLCIDSQCHPIAKVAFFRGTAFDELRIPASELQVEGQDVDAATRSFEIVIDQGGWNSDFGGALELYLLML
ncbi:MAG: hypothetical protein KGZ83_18760 [Sulfuricella sp.]|nr:hypothetical protein [Sulfuricella sp.]